MNSLCADPIVQNQQTAPLSPTDFPPLVSLDGTWKLSGCARPAEESMSLDALVPGHVHLDLIRAGRIPDPFWRDQADKCQWVEHWDWTYEKEFALPGNFEGRRAVLEFGGLDTFATIHLNGFLVGNTDNMFLAHRFEVGGMLRPGRNILRVRFDSIWRHVEGKPRDAECAFENQERLYVRRMQCTFHWDWVHRFVSAGIWRGVTLRFPSCGRIEDLFVGTREIIRAKDDSTCALSARLRIRWETELRATEPMTAELEVLDPAGDPVWTVTRTVATGHEAVELDAPLARPRLWWPNGAGDQPRYSARLRLHTQDGAELDRREIRFGVRTVELERTPDVPGSAAERRTRELRARHPERDGRNGDAPGESFAVRVNGERIFCKGGNWVPADPWPSRVSTAHYERLLGLAREANVNCLRGWGGGIYEPEAFWDACDRLGILVCQDFMAACGHYPEHDEAFLEAMRTEAPAVIRALRNHPSLAWWIGDNENGMKFDFDDPATAGRKVAEEILRPALAELDPDRPFIPTSPFGGRPNNSQTIGDVHLSGLPYDQAGMTRDWRHYRTWIEDSIGRFNSECVTAGSPPLRSLRRFLSDADIDDPSSPMWYYHTKDNPYLDLRMFDVQCQASEKLFGPLLDPLDFVPRNSYLQYEFARLTIEAARRQKGYNWGLLFWMFNDCWPATGWSFVDYYGAPKAGWYAMKRAFAPVIASLEDVGDRYRVWICNDRLAPVSGRFTLRVALWQGTPRVARSLVPFHLQANAASCVHEISKVELAAGVASVVVCDLETTDGTLARGWHFEGMPCEMQPPATTLSFHVRAPSLSQGSLEVSSVHYARCVMIETDADLEDNYFDLLPGETRVVRWTARGPASDLPRFDLRCWNQTR
jgi:beta-mannosidase